MSTLWPIAACGAESTDAYARYGDIRVHYKSVGTGRSAIVFVHGWACSAEFWKSSLHELPEYRVIAIDLPGHGSSDKPRVDYTIEYFARSIAAVMQDAGVEHAVLAGHSMGAPVVRHFYRLYPRATLGLIVVDGPMMPVPEDRMRPLLERLHTRYGDAVATAVDELVRPIADERLRSEIRSTMLETPDYVGVSALQAMRDAAVWKPDRIEVPMLVILAASSQWGADVETYCRLLARQLDFQVWPDVGHFLMLERPANFNAAVLRFVSSNRLPGIR